MDFNLFHFSETFYCESCFFNVGLNKNWKYVVKIELKMENERFIKSIFNWK